MSNSSRSDTDESFFDVDELLHIEERCRELRREKDLLKVTQSQSFDLIRRLELHVRKLNEARIEDKRQIHKLERELNNCHQEIDYLQDQLNERNAYVDSLEKHVNSLDIKLSNIDVLEGNIASLREELKKSNSECEFLMQDLETKETELQESYLLIEKLEESISSSALDYQCEIESMRLDMTALEQKCLACQKAVDESNQEKISLKDSLSELQNRLNDAQKNMKHLEDERKLARDRLNAFEREAKLFCQRIQEHFKGRLQSSAAAGSLLLPSNVDERCGLAGTSELSSCGVILGPLLSKLLTVETSDADDKLNTEKVTFQLSEYEVLVKGLKEELKNEKSKAKEEAEDLAQEMAELRYQMTELLEEERKRRVCIEQTSLQRISELEAQLQVEQRKSFAASHGICEA